MSRMDSVRQAVMSRLKAATLSGFGMAAALPAAATVNESGDVVLDAFGIQPIGDRFDGEAPQESNFATLFATSLCESEAAHDVAATHRRRSIASEENVHKSKSQSTSESKRVRFELRFCPLKQLACDAPSR